MLIWEFEEDGGMGSYFYKRFNQNGLIIDECNVRYYSGEEKLLFSKPALYFKDHLNIISDICNHNLLDLKNKNDLNLWGDFFKSNILNVKDDFQYNLSNPNLIRKQIAGFFVKDNLYQDNVNLLKHLVITRTAKENNFIFSLKFPHILSVKSINNIFNVHIIVELYILSSNRKHSLSKAAFKFISFI